MLVTSNNNVIITCVNCITLENQKLKIRSNPWEQVFQSPFVVGTQTV